MVICMERIQPDRCFGSCQEHPENDPKRSIWESMVEQAAPATPSLAQMEMVEPMVRLRYRIDQEKFPTMLAALGGQIGSWDPRVSGRTENCGEYYRECLGREAVADDLHVALCLGNDLRSSTKPDGERMADELHAKSDKEPSNGCAHTSPWAVIRRERASSPEPTAWERSDRKSPRLRR